MGEIAYPFINFYKNIVKHTAHTIVSWPNPKQWLMILCLLIGSLGWKYFYPIFYIGCNLLSILISKLTYASKCEPGITYLYNSVEVVWLVNGGNWFRNPSPILHSKAGFIAQGNIHVPERLILGLSSANGRCRYKITPSLIGWAQAYN